MEEYYDFLLENDPDFLGGATKEQFLNAFKTKKDVEDYYDFIAENKPSLIEGVEKEEFVENLPLAVSAEPKQKPAEEDTGSFLGDVGEKLLAGSAAGLALVARAPAYMLDIAKQAASPLSQNDPAALSYSAQPNPIAEKLEAYAESKRKQGEEFDKGLVQYAKDGEYGKFFRSLGNQVAESLPITLGIIGSALAGVPTPLLTVGGGLIFGAGEMKELEDSEMSQQRKLLVSYGKGAAEMIFENLFGVVPGITKVARDVLAKEGKEAAVKVFKEGVEKAISPYRKYGGIMLEEMMSEGATQLTQNFIDKYIGDKPELDILENVVDASIVGLGSSAFLTGVAAPVEMAVQKERRNRLAELDGEKTDLAAGLSTEESDAVKELLEDKMDSLQEEENQIVEKEKEMVESLDPDSQEAVINLRNERNEIERKLGDENLSEVVRATLSERLAEVENEIENYVAPPKAKPVEKLPEIAFIDEEQLEGKEVTLPVLNEETQEIEEVSLPATEAQVNIQSQLTPIREKKTQGEPLTPEETAKEAELLDNLSSMREQLQIPAPEITEPVEPVEEETVEQAPQIESEKKPGDYAKLEDLAQRTVQGENVYTPQNKRLLTKYPNFFEQALTKAREGQDLPRVSLPLPRGKTATYTKNPDGKWVSPRGLVLDPQNKGHRSTISRLNNELAKQQPQEPVSLQDERVQIEQRLSDPQISQVEKLDLLRRMDEIDASLAENVPENVSETTSPVSGITPESEEIVAPEPPTQATEQGEENIQFQVDAFHGSPSEFDRFSTEKIGTGEGAQVFGWGLYFTDLVDVAKSYANKLPGLKIGNKEIRGRMAAWYFDNKDSLRDSIKDLEEDLPVLSKPSLFGKQFKKDAEILIDAIKNNKKIDIIGARNLYKVTLHKGKTPSQYNWMRWDERLSDQHRDAIIKQANKEGIGLKEHTYPSGSKGIIIPGERSNMAAIATTGEQVYEWLRLSTSRISGRRIFKSRREVSLFLLRAGIDGIKYPAESIARGATSSTARGFNYVVFDENAVTIDERIQFQTQESAETEAVSGKTGISSRPVNTRRLNELQRKKVNQRTDKEHAEFIKEKLRKVFSEKGVPLDQIDAAIAIMDARAKIASPLNPDLWYRRLEDIRQGEFQGADPEITQGTKGALETLENGRKVVHALNNPDFSTLIHEMAHVFEVELTPEEKSAIQNWAETKNWTRKTSEAFARGFERYLRDGESPNKELKSIFEKAKEWMQNIYRSLVGTPIEKNITPEIREIFDNLLGTDFIRADEAQNQAYEDVVKGNAPMHKVFLKDVLRILGTRLTPYERTSLNAIVQSAIDKGYTMAVNAGEIANNYLVSIDPKTKRPAEKLSVEQRIGIAFVAESTRRKIKEMHQTFANTNFNPKNGDITIDEKTGNVYIYQKGNWLTTKERKKADEALGKKLTQDAIDQKSAEEVTKIRNAQEGLERLYKALSLSGSMAGLELGIISRVLKSATQTADSFISDLEKTKGEPLDEETVRKINATFERIKTIQDRIDSLEEKDRRIFVEHIEKIAEDKLKKARAKKRSAGDIAKAVRDIINRDDIQFQSEITPTELLKILNELVDRLDPENLNDLFSAVKKLHPDVTYDQMLEAYVMDSPVYQKQAIPKAEKAVNKKKQQIRKEAKMIDQIQQMVVNAFNKVKKGYSVPPTEIKKLSQFIRELQEAALTDPNLNVDDGERLMMMLSNLQEAYDQVIFQGKVFTKLGTTKPEATEQERNRTRNEIKKMVENFREYLIEGKEYNNAKHILKELDRALNDELKENRKTIPTANLKLIDSVRKKINGVVNQEGEVTEEQKRELLNDITNLQEKFIEDPLTPYALDELTTIITNLRKVKEVQKNANSIQGLKDSLDRMLNNEFLNEKGFTTEVQVTVSRIRKKINRLARQAVPNVEELKGLINDLETLNHNFPQPLKYTENDLNIILANVRKFQQLRKIDNVDKRIKELDDKLKRIKQGDLEGVLAELEQESDRGDTYASAELRQKRRQLDAQRSILNQIRKENTKGGLGKFLMNLNDLYRALVLSLDISFTGVHGLMFGLHRYPLETLGFFRKAWMAMMSSSAFHEISDSIANNPVYLRSQSLANNLRITELGGKFQSGIEEFPSNWVRDNKIIGQAYRGSERGFTTFINLVRMHAFETYMKANADAGVVPTDAELSLVVDQINTYTGGSRVGYKDFNWEGGLNVASLAVIAPRMYFSFFKTVGNLTLLPDVYRLAKVETPAERRAILHRMKQSLIILGSLSIPYIVGSFLGADLEDDVRDSQFGAIQYKDRSITPNPLVSYARLLAQLLTKAGNTFGFWYSEEPQHQYFNNLNAMDIFFRWGKYKWSPLLSSLWGLASGESAIGEPLMGRTTAETVKNFAGIAVPVPIAMSQVIETLPRGAAEELNKYLPEEFKIEGEFGAGESAFQSMLALMGIGSFAYGSKYNYVAVEKFLEKNNLTPTIPYRKSKGDPEWNKLRSKSRINPFGYYFRRDFRSRIGEFILEQIEDGRFKLEPTPSQLRIYKGRLKKEAEKIRKELQREYIKRYGDVLKNWND